MIIGIRREDKNIWERRVPLVPKDVATLHRQHGVEFQVQTFPARAFPDDEYRDAGAQVVPELDDSDFIMAVKEIPIELLRKGKQYLFFSHTIKGQDYNMPLLQRLLDLNCTLIDYERIVDAEGRRLVFFGHHAGTAGMIDALHAFGKRLLASGHDTIFNRIRPAYVYTDLDQIAAELQQLGKLIRQEGLPAAIETPLVVGFAGYGNVSQGAQAILDYFPVVEISPAELGHLTVNAEEAQHTIYKVVFHEEHLVRRRDGGAFDLQQYYREPEHFESIFSHYLNDLTVLINAIYWDERYPRLLTRDYAQAAWNRGELRRLQVIGDISIDIEGSIELSYKATESDNPSYVYNPVTGQFSDGVSGEGLLIVAVDNLPCELPRESSRSFSEALTPFIPGIARADWSQEFAHLEIPDPIRKAVIAHQGSLTPDYQYLQESLNA